MRQNSVTLKKSVNSTRPGKGLFKDIKKNGELLLLSAPAVILLFIFNYMPIYGIILAFKNYRYDLGIMGSQWVGFDNFEFFFKSQDAWRVTRNTVGLNALFIFVGLFCAVAFALMMFELRNRMAVKTYQTVFILPSFLSWVVVGYMTYAFLNPSLGILNKVLEMLGKESISWYTEPSYWPMILVIVHIWKVVGTDSIIYYAGLMGIDKELFEAARIDGANRWQITTRISLPSLAPLITIMTILAIGRIFRADFGMFYNLTMDSGMLYSTTDVIDTYVYRALKSLGDVGMSSAVGLYQSVVGFVLVMVTNAIVKRIEPDNALF
ncbi:ABC transporter permease [Mahella australiensis]|uniref:Carbohydrate ABC transporter membrane protein 1, CUT1 family n=1 Tax=Mahella australiensis (strain DSM 15567 / CIP 107919 / 50-1 BON) TaxID=697281 RepID=F3ZYP2_MAHA5|nr:ABC transporter permease subunit [Mahella australiensis]AEE97810.1 carbohydrate ABC transporter membrane protein 1, CUT1 family [Mahella australiensis 50-1 BON]